MFTTPFKQLNLFVKELQQLQSNQIKNSTVDVRMLRDMVLGYVIMNKNKFVKQ